MLWIMLAKMVGFVFVAVTVYAILTANKFLRRDPETVIDDIADVGTPS